MHGFESYVTLAEALDAKITEESKKLGFWKIAFMSTKLKKQRSL